ncbi:DNA repair protein RadC [Hydrogenimonas sp.]|uniref:RadC family protein n=1 Tax=Hydrogenimonas sp. TaxID=2231112 RepID=UPI00262675F0|nr:DNA repair protein RadC [Hydrogenimonas sp.]
MKRVDELYEKDRPREKLKAKGPAALKNYELIAVLLGSGTKGQDVIRLARAVEKLLEADFEGLTLDRLTSVHGLGPAKAMQILAAIELSRRHLVRQNVKIACAEDVWQHLRDYADKKQEYFLAITLDGAGHIIEKRVVTVGTLNQSLVHPRELFADAIADRAAGVVIAHNHPSGQCFPSAEDRRVTSRLREASRILGIELIDHVILTKEGWFSFAEEGEL